MTKAKVKLLEDEIVRLRGLIESKEADLVKALGVTQYLVNGIGKLGEDAKYAVDSFNTNAARNRRPVNFTQEAKEAKEASEEAGKESSAPSAPTATAGTP